MSEPFTSEEQKSEMLIGFQSITGTDDLEACSSILEEHGWDLERAVNAHFGYVNAATQEGGGPSSSVGGQRNLSSGTQGRGSGGVFDWIMALFWAPASFSLNLLSVLFGFVGSLFPSFFSTQGRLEGAGSFGEELEKCCGDSHPVLFEGNYKRLIDAGKRDLKFVLVYLHSSEHQDTARFCRSVVANPQFIEYVNSKFLFWGGDVRYQEAFRVYNSLDGIKFPFLAVIALVDNRMVVVGRLQGLLSTERVIERLTQIVDRTEPALVVARRETEERNMNQMIRQEQDAAYLESLRQDQEKKRLREEAEARERREQEEAAERENAMKRAAEEAKRMRLERLQMLPEEPVKAGPGVTTVVVRLPDGGRLQRRFRNEDKVYHIYDYVHGQDIGIDSFSLSSSYPKREVESSEETLEKAGLTPNIMLFLKNDEDDVEEDD
eukprot:Nk52_evm26s745 gene=Nk52_evmTU26s745